MFGLLACGGLVVVWCVDVLMCRFVVGWWYWFVGLWWCGVWMYLYVVLCWCGGGVCLTSLLVCCGVVCGVSWYHGSMR